MVSGSGSSAVAILVLGASLALSVPALAQPAQGSERGDTPFATWILIGTDVSVHDRWRGIARIGHLGEFDSRIVIAELIFVQRQTVHLLMGQVSIAPTTAGTTHTSLTRLGATWLPVRRRVTVESRFLLERLSSGGAHPSIRGRNRIRISWSQPARLPAAVVGAVEGIASTRSGLVENRIQLGAARSVGRLYVEGYWLHRQLRGSAAVNGVGVTAVWRIGK